MKKVRRLWTWVSSRNLAFYLPLFVFWVFLALRQPFFLDMVTLGNTQYDESVLLEEVMDSKVPDPLKLRRGVRYYTELNAILPDQDYAFGNMGYCYFQLGDTTKALWCYSRASQINPKIYFYPFNQGMLYFYLKKFDKAVLHLQQALKAMPKTIDYYQGFLNDVDAKNVKAKSDLAYAFFMVLERIKGDRPAAIVQVIRSYLSMNDQEGLKRFLFENLPGLLAAGSPDEYWTLAENYVNSLKAYWWENLPPQERLRPDYLFGPQVVKILLFSELIADEMPAKRPSQIKPKKQKILMEK